MWIHISGYGDPVDIAKKYAMLLTMLMEKSLPRAKKNSRGDNNTTFMHNGIEIIALHSHMITEKPRLFYMHCLWSIQ
jgi:hypothetical protein